ncbi:MAG: NUDIX hydrolase, associated with Thiamin pyrophosphokinase [uncultured Sulfurovum sp.]|uniref:NUDIX hydrolase, associated with Thiamin pyrophosphokinase n=1 Tax=uncultured Sulfurovum sp. TaxID=269237 RepID=A0A6S6U289_9BACT|nr:MAG: NUDIX hydrolase, associated with Thiamin pyrophosphokinase [uncultured Sulfurovum sp.]
MQNDDTKHIYSKSNGLDCILIKRKKMSYMNRIDECNKYEEANKIPFVVDGLRVGQVFKEHEAYCLTSGFFVREGNALTLKESYKTFEQRTEVFTIFAKNALADGLANRYMNENFPLLSSASSEPLAFLDRGISNLFGTLSFGQHLNAYVMTDDGMKMWIARRAYDRGYEAGKLDHMVAGGLPCDLSPLVNLQKECYEEAGMSEALALESKQVGLVSYKYDYTMGGKEEIIYCYDLEVKADFVPVCTDGEVHEFYLMPIEEVARLVRDTDEFKLNCNLVIIDFLVRHGYIGLDDEDYVEIVKGLRR